MSLQAGVTGAAAAKTGAVGRADWPPPPDGLSNRNPPGMTFWALVREDYRTHDRNWAAQGFWAVFWHRFGNWRMGLPKPLRAPCTVIYRVMFKLGEMLGGISIPYSVPIGRRVKIEHFGGVVISARRIGDDVIIRQNTTMGVASTAHVDRRPVIGDQVDIGAGAVIIGDVRVGDRCVIGANAVVTRDVPDDCVAAGVPATARPRRGRGDAGASSAV